MENLRTVADRCLLNRLAFKILMVLSVLVTAVPYLHTAVGGYVKFVLLYGFVIIGYELLTGKLADAFRKKTNWLLIGFCIFYAITLFLNRAGNLTAGVKSFAYMISFFVLFFMTKNGQTKASIIREIKVLAFVIILGTFLLSAVSLATFIFSVSGKYLNGDGIVVYYGMFENRLWGLYNPNTGATLNGISILLSVGCLCTVKNRISTVFNGVNLFLQFSCLLLTGSRASYYMVVVTLMILTAFWTLQRFPRTTLRAGIAAFLSMVLIAATIMGVGAVLRLGYAYAPSVTAAVFAPKEGTDETPPVSDDDTAPVTPPANTDNIEKQDFTRLEELEGREGGFFNGRAPMWAACFKTFKEAPLFGVGYENLIERTLPHFQDNTWKEHFRTGGPHNIYITILTSCGALGFVLLGLFAAVTFVRSATVLLKTYRKGNVWLLLSICICVMFYITEFVESRILFQVSTFSVFFWLFVGYMYRLAMDTLE